MLAKNLFCSLLVSMSSDGCLNLVSTNCFTCIYRDIINVNIKEYIYKN